MRIPKKAMVPVATALVLAAACERQLSLETMTFPVDNLTQGQVEELLMPYVYSDRESDPGTIAAIQGAVTVRETRDNLARIQRVLEEFDVPLPDVRLHFQLVEANGFTAVDPRIGDVEAELRALFDFQGYRLAAEATILARDNTQIVQGMRGPGGQLFELRGFIERVERNTTGLYEVGFSSSDGWQLSTSVSIRDGQTLVLGTSPNGDRAGTLFLTVRAETAPVGDEGSN